MAQVEFPMEKIISTTVSGQPKTEILNQLQQDFPEMKYLFIEDKLSTLEKVNTAFRLRGLDYWTGVFGGGVNRMEFVFSRLGIQYRR